MALVIPESRIKTIIPGPGSREQLPRPSLTDRYKAASDQQSMRAANMLFDCRDRRHDRCYIHAPRDRSVSQNLETNTRYSISVIDLPSYEDMFVGRFLSITEETFPCSALLAVAFSNSRPLLAWG